MKPFSRDTYLALSLVAAVGLFASVVGGWPLLAAFNAGALVWWVDGVRNGR